MNFFADGLAEKRLRVVRFEFPYMSKSRETGKKGPPNPLPALRETWLQVIKKLGAKGLVIGGKSMGGRIASLIAADAGVDGLVCLGYPFHPVGKPDQLRVEHLKTIKTPTLILQGDRDPFGNREEVAALQAFTSGAGSLAQGWRPQLQAAKGVGQDAGRELGAGAGSIDQVRGGIQITPVVEST